MPINKRASILGFLTLTAFFTAAGCSDDEVENADAGVAGDTGVPAADAGGYPDAAGNADAEPDAGLEVVVTSTRPRNGSALMMTKDDAVLLVVNRRTGRNGTAGQAKIERYSVDLAANTLSLQGAEDLAGASQVIIGSDDQTAYAAGATEVVKYTNFRSSSLTRGGMVAAGAEPRGIALSPTGRRLYVANWADGTVTVINTAGMTVKSTVDLNNPLLQSGLLGAKTTASRPALAHPYAIAITNDGDTDDDDETVYVTEFFSQARAGGPTDDSGFDLGRQGVIYRFDVNTETVGPLITLAPVADTGFLDSNGVTTGCFPNQLNAATINSGRLYVTATCESPRGPVGPILDGNNALSNPANFKTQVHAAVFVVDTQTHTELPAQGLLLTRAFQSLYDTASVPDDGANRRVPLIPNDIAFAPGTTIGYVTSYGSDAVFRIQYNADGMLNQVGSSTQRFINLTPMGQTAGRLPFGIGISSNGRRALVVNEFSRNVSFLTFATQNVVGTANLTDAAPTGVEANINVGKRFFVTGLGRWSFRGQGWNSCESCHPGGLTDNVTWFFARGPRQTTSLDGSYSSANPAQRRLFNWTAIFDETHDFELNTRGNSGGVGAIVHASSMPPAAPDRIHFDGTAPTPAGALPTATPQNGLNGSTIALMPGGLTPPVSTLEDWNQIDAYVKVIRSPRAPSNLSATDVTEGRQIFDEGNCAGCHGTDMWTISRVFYTPNETNNNPTAGLLRSNDYTANTTFPQALNPPTSGGNRTAPLRFVGADAAANAANDQINCALRAVGTFPAALDAMQTGIAPSGVRVREVRQNMTAAAQGASGFNPPSLLGLATGAPYFHAGNARTLEETLASVFEAHHTAFSSNFLSAGEANRATRIRQLVAFLLSIDESTTAFDVPTNLGFDATLCPDSF